MATATFKTKESTINLAIDKYRICFSIGSKPDFEVHILKDKIDVYSDTVQHIMGIIGIMADMGEDSLISFKVNNQIGNKK